MCVGYLITCYLEMMFEKEVGGCMATLCHGSTYLFIVVAVDLTCPPSFSLPASTDCSLS